MTVDPAAEKAMSKAKFELMQAPRTVFYTTILFSLILEWTEKHSHAAVNGTHLYVNPVKWLELTPEQRKGLLIHEILHVALGHLTRTHARDPLQFNRAADYVINLMVTDAGYELPPGGLFDRKFENMNAEQVYDIIYQPPPKGGGTPGGPIPGIGSDILAPSNPDDVTPLKEKITNVILRATTQARLCGDEPGSIPAGILVELDKDINPKLPWNIILRNFLDDFAKDDYSMQRPNRRFLPEYYLPSAHSEAIDRLSIAVDASCSVSQYEFSYFINEIAEIQELMKPKEIVILDFDTEIKNIHRAVEGTNILTDLEFKGGGGTDIKDVLQWAKENTPNVLLIFSDGEFRMRADPGVPVIWLIHDDPKWTAPFGTVINYDIPNK